MSISTSVFSFISQLGDLKMSDTNTQTMAQQIAEAAIIFERNRVGRSPKSVSVVLVDNTLVITLHGALTEAEKMFALDPAGAAKVREFHRQLFETSSAWLLSEIKRITGVEVKESTAEIETKTGTIVQAFTTGTMVQVFLLASAVPTETWNESMLNQHLK